MDDPWKNINSATLTGLPVHEVVVSDFDDNFCPDSVETGDIIPPTVSFDKLPDSSQYLANLEKKLLKVKKKPSSSSAEKRDLLLSLSGAREGHINRLLNNQIPSNISCEEDFDQTVNSLTTTLVRHITPHLQAVNTVETIELLKADQLEIANSEDSVEIENIKNSSS